MKFFPFYSENLYKIQIRNFNYIFDNFIIEFRSNEFYFSKLELGNTKQRYKEKKYNLPTLIKAYYEEIKLR